MAERPIAAVLKTVEPARVPGVQILSLRVYNLHTVRVLDSFNEKAAMR